MLVLEVKTLKTNESTMKKYILLFCLALNSTHTLVSSLNEPTNSQSTNSSIIELNYDTDESSLPFISQNRYNQQGQIIYLNNPSQEDAQVNDGHDYHDEDNYDDGFPNIFHQPTPPNNNQLNHHDENQFQDFFDQITQPNTPIEHNNNHLIVRIISQEETQNATVLQRTVAIRRDGRWPYAQYLHNDSHVVSQETDNSSQEQ